jgi:2-iminobutanoate/2-iminopropanoate deaminase
MSERTIIPAPTRGLDLKQSLGLPQSTVVRSGDLLFLSGVLAVHPGTGERMHGTLTSETHQCLQNLSMILGRAGSSLEKVVRVHAMMYSRIEYDVFNSVYRQYFPALQAPARTVWSVGILYGLKVQLDVIATLQGA